MGACIGELEKKKKTKTGFFSVLKVEPTDLVKCSAVEM